VRIPSTLAFILILVIAFIDATAAELRFPTLLLIHAKSGSASMTMTSTEKRDVTITLSVLEPGKGANDPALHAKTLVPYLRCRDSAFVLRPGESRTITFETALPASAATGEYAARVRVQWNAAEDPGAERLVHVVLRKGDVYSDIKLGKFGAVRDGAEVRFTIDLIQLGNAGYCGNMHMNVLNANGTVLYALDQAIDVFTSAQLTITVPGSRLPAGRYRVTLGFDSDRPELGAAVIPVLPKNYTIDLSLR
jgi:hypothetical protein